MNSTRVAWVLRADGVFNLLAGLVALTFYGPVVALVGWPETDAPVYPNVLGAALVGLSLAVLFAAGHPERSRDTILATVVAKVLAGVILVYWIFVAGIELPSPWLLPAAVAAQVLFALGEAAYLLSGARGAREEATR
jgi:hypothetical protein